VAYLQELADEVVCPLAPPMFRAVGLAYRDFSPVSDEEVRALLHRAGRPTGGSGSMGS
jgi:predicted phosphoribosyltransferase